MFIGGARRGIDGWQLVNRKARLLNEIRRALPIDREKRIASDDYCGV